jgi:hypothetical protein
MRRKKKRFKRRPTPELGRSGPFQVGWFWLDGKAPGLGFRPGNVLLS